MKKGKVFFHPIDGSAICKLLILTIKLPFQISILTELSVDFHGKEILKHRMILALKNHEDL